MRIVIEREDIEVETPDKLLDLLEQYRTDFHEEFAEWWANNHGGDETLAFVRTLVNAYVDGPQGENEKTLIRKVQQRLYFGGLTS